ncbi:MAG: hypothetical protein RID07_20875 [Lacipirellulaceae bacterium]
MLFSAGCQQGIVGQLQGEWVGTPKPPKKAATKDAGQPVTQSENATKQEVKLTDWQSYDAQVGMKFTDSQVEVTMDGQSDKVVAKWRVLEQTPANILVEFITETKQPPTNEEPATETQPSKVLRRFEIIPELEEEKLTGFALNEEGADRQVGRLYFVRKGQQAKTKNVSATDDSQD